MSVTTEKNKNRIVRAVTLGVNLAYDETLWKYFSDNPVDKCDTAEEKVMRLILFEFVLSQTVGTETKNFKYMKEEPIKSAVYHVTGYKEYPIDWVIVMLKGHCEMIRLTPKAMVDIYREAMEGYVPNRFLYAFSILHVVMKHLRPIFDKGKRITPEEIASVTKQASGILHEKIVADEAGWLAEMTGMKKERADEIIRSIRETFAGSRDSENSSAENVGSDTESKEK